MYAICQCSGNPGSQWKGQIKTSFGAPVRAETHTCPHSISDVQQGRIRAVLYNRESPIPGDFDVSTDYKKITWEIVGKEGEDGLCFDLGAVANTYYIDDIKLVNQTDPSNGTVINNEIPNGTFEVDAGGWTIFNGDKTQNLHCADLAYVYEGNGCMQFVNGSDNPGSQWKGQIKTSFSGPIIAGDTYQLSFYIRCATGTGSGRCSTTGNPQYQGDFEVTTEYSKITWEIVGKEGEDMACALTWEPRPIRIILTRSTR